MEIWKTIKGFKNYQVSNLGRILSLERTIIKKNKYGTIIYIKIPEKIIKANNKYSHKCICLTGKNIKKQTSIHREVFKAFKTKILNKYVINHIDGDKSNNNIENLEMITQSENILHAYKNNLFTTASYLK
jgi:hypothetical protein